MKGQTSSKYLVWYLLRILNERMLPETYAFVISTEEMSPEITHAIYTLARMNLED